ncbi:MAG: hypothetical protein KAR35_05035 [Candidatus Heimdallarchaeota archaeon]|nr:hypothetical protein [Candidatus Heimdallarchaeota archaeon]MCK5048721.1 hypothetical protein [Candidatus Heimdallarchaeota archaeon]
MNEEEINLSKTEESEVLKQEEDDLEKEKAIPFTYHHSFAISDEKELNLFVSGFRNGVSVYLYENYPQMGSLSLAIPAISLTGRSELLTIFAGQHQIMANALAEIVSNKIQSPCLASVFLSETNVDISILSKLINEALPEILKLKKTKEL